MDLPTTEKEQQERDHAVYFIEGGDPGFSPERNKAVVAATIKKTNDMRKLRNRLYADQIGERIDAVVSYLRSNTADSNRPVEQYFSKQMLAHLRGQQIANIIQTKIANQQRKVYLPS